ncbi:hypothetical protein ACRALDRAFT_2021218 [Sodiomyces alcalophilus JCM 7366]|uniref:uncharacterized protein n=1 Tax=Sodiomyces alcalophilus JCM 7366 TaxID=591952 RepID=UPI0039B44678
MSPTTFLSATASLPHTQPIQQIYVMATYSGSWKPGDMGHQVIPSPVDDDERRFEHPSDFLSVQPVTERSAVQNPNLDLNRHCINCGRPSFPRPAIGQLSKFPQLSRHAVLPFHVNSVLGNLHKPHGGIFFFFFLPWPACRFRSSGAGMASMPSFRCGPDGLGMLEPEHSLPVSDNHPCHWSIPRATRCNGFRSRAGSPFHEGLTTYDIYSTAPDCGIIELHMLTRPARLLTPMTKGHRIRGLPWAGRLMSSPSAIHHPLTEPTANKHEELPTKTLESWHTLHPIHICIEWGTILMMKDSPSVSSVQSDDTTRRLSANLLPAYICFVNVSSLDPSGGECMLVVHILPARDAPPQSNWCLWCFNLTLGLKQRSMHLASPGVGALSFCLRHGDMRQSRLYDKEVTGKREATRPWEAAGDWTGVGQSRKAAGYVDRFTWLQGWWEELTELRGSEYRSANMNNSDEPLARQLGEQHSSRALLVNRQQGNKDLRAPHNFDKSAQPLLTCEDAFPHSLSLFRTSSSPRFWNSWIDLCGKFYVSIRSRSPLGLECLFGAIVGLPYWKLHGEVYRTPHLLGRCTLSFFCFFFTERFLIFPDLSFAPVTFLEKSSDLHSHTSYDLHDGFSCSWARVLYGSVTGEASSPSHSSVSVSQRQPVGITAVSSEAASHIPSRNTLWIDEKMAPKRRYGGSGEPLGRATERGTGRDRLFPNLEALLERAKEFGSESHSARSSLYYSTAATASLIASEDGRMNPKVTLPHAPNPSLLPHFDAEMNGERRAQSKKHKGRFWYSVWGKKPGDAGGAEVCNDWVCFQTRSCLCAGDVDAHGMGCTQKSRSLLKCYTDPITSLPTSGRALAVLWPGYVQVSVVASSAVHVARRTHPRLT